MKEHSEPSKEETKLQSEQFPQGWIDWNKLSLQEHIDHLKGKFAYSSEGTAKSVFELIQAYETLKQSQSLPIEGGERERLKEAFEAGQNADEYDQWVKHNYDFDQWLATRKGSKPDNQ